MNLHGAVVIITGASSGIGAAAAQAFATAGARVVLAARSAERLEQIAATLPGTPLVVPTDISQEAEAHRLVEQAIAAHGHVDILINNAGIGVGGPVATVSAADVQRVLSVNLLGPIYTIQAVVPHMRQRRQGQIINVSSVLGAYALPYAGGYAASKGALDRLTEALRMELLGSGIHVSLVRPGTTRTEFGSRRLGHGAEKRLFSPGGVAPEKVAQTLLYVAQRHPRLAYVSMGDRLRLLITALFPGLVERLLPWVLKWTSEERIAKTHDK